ncbi:MAG TPA: BON domain-containing protein, partial [Myxococcota bacterium]|nr:BON domain-containing protein [Myxococcota bacterium]
MKLTSNWLGTAALALCLSAALPAAAMETPDAWITTKVKMSLLTSAGVSTATAVNVDTVDGKVTLHGVVPSDAERTHAEDVARSIDGVRTVQNLLQVVPASLKKQLKIADDHLAKNVEVVLARDKALESS